MDSLSTAFTSLVNALDFFVWNLSIPLGPDLELPWLVVLLLGAGVFLTLRMGLIQFRKLGHAVAIVSGKYDKPGDEGDISHFQALSTALSATVGIGNIAGVAMAIHFGGPGAVFWMWCTALLGMCTKYTEVSLAMKYRDFDEEGNASGGPHKYIEKGMGHRWKPVAFFFAACAILSSLGAGNMNVARLRMPTIAPSKSGPEMRSPL
jgi:AGCS family alanine or glycine:cation symporter